MKVPARSSSASAKVPARSASAKASVPAKSASAKATVPAKSAAAKAKVPVKSKGTGYPKPESVPKRGPGSTKASKVMGKGQSYAQNGEKGGNGKYVTATLTGKSSSLPPQGDGAVRR